MHTQTRVLAAWTRYRRKLEHLTLNSPARPVKNLFFRLLENQAALPEREAEAALPMVVANIVGDNARIKTNSIDASTNTVAINLSQQFASMRDAFKSAIDDRQTLEAILDRVASLEKAANAKAPLIPPLNELLSVAANWVTVLTSFLPILGTLVQH